MNIKSLEKELVYVPYSIVSFEYLLFSFCNQLLKFIADSMKMIFFLV